MENVFSKECKCCGATKTIDHFKKSRWGGYVSVCTECANQKRHDTNVRKKQEKELEKARVKNAIDNRRQILSEFKPRELMEELARRGYKGNLTYTQTIDICNF